MASANPHGSKSTMVQRGVVLLADLGQTTRLYLSKGSLALLSAPCSQTGPVSGLRQQPATILDKLLSSHLPAIIPPLRLQLASEVPNSISRGE